VTGTETQNSAVLDCSICTAVGLLLELDCSICNIMEIEQSVTESMHSAVSNRLFYLHVS